MIDVTWWAPRILWWCFGFFNAFIVFLFILSCKRSEKYESKGEDHS